MNADQRAVFEWSVVTADGMRDKCPDAEDARRELTRWPEYVRIEVRYVTSSTWTSVP